MNRRPLLLLAPLSALALGCSTSPRAQVCGSATVTATGAAEVTGFGDNPGALRMFVYAPAAIASPAPLVVALHGCTQSAAAYQNAGWNALADAGGFYVVYPETDANGECFAWYDTANARRGAGQAESIAEMVGWMQAHHAIDGARVFVTGLSAGGAMTAVMAASYPDLFSGAAIMAGIPYRCADSQSAAFGCMYGTTTMTAPQWGDLVRGADPTWSGPRPRMSVWQGSSDVVVNESNAGQLVSQWTDVQGIDATADASEVVGPATHDEFRDASGHTLVERWMIGGMGHGVAIDPSHGCGAAAPYVLDVGLCSSARAASFFGLDATSPQPGGSPTPTPPPC